MVKRVHMVRNDAGEALTAADMYNRTEGLNVYQENAPQSLISPPQLEQLDSVMSDPLLCSPYATYGV